MFNKKHDLIAVGSWKTIMYDEGAHTMLQKVNIKIKPLKFYDNLTKNK